MNNQKSLNHTERDCKCHVVSIALLPNSVHMMLSVLPKHSVPEVVGFVKGQSAIYLARVYRKRKRNFVGQSFWAWRCFVSAAGHDEAVLRECIRNQAKEDESPDHLGLWRRVVVTSRWYQSNPEATVGYRRRSMIGHAYNAPFAARSPPHAASWFGLRLADHP